MLFFTFAGQGIAKVSKQVTLPVPATTEVTTLFNPPLFGVTALGCSHGFDPMGSTTGFVIWINGRGLMVDPPPHSSHVLAREGIPARLIDGVIVTHCHADHDAGTFQKILQEKRIMVMTTSTILQSFLRKYSALSNMSTDLLRSLFEFRPAIVGDAINWHGAALRFFYAFHSIPCVGFECSFGGKSFVYSADTFYEPNKLAELHTSGVLSEGRMNRLLRFPWHADVILHEAGVPPIHTPVKVLQELPADVQQRLYLVHIAKKDLPADMRRLEAGVAHTIHIPAAAPPHAAAIEVLDLVGRIELFDTLTIAEAREVLICAKRERFAAGTAIISRDDPGDRFFIISRGIARVVVNQRLIKRFTIGDYFGEYALVTNARRSADVRAETDVECLVFDQQHFLFLLNHRQDIIDRMIHLHSMRSHPSWEALQSNSLLADLSSSQLTELQSIMQLRTVAAGEYLWRFNQTGATSPGVLILNAELQLVCAANQSVSRLGAGQVVAEVRALLRTRPRSFPASGSGRQRSNVVGCGSSDSASSPTAADPVVGVAGASALVRNGSARGAGLFFPESYSIIDQEIGKPHTTELICISTGDVFVFPAQPFLEFLRRTPKLFLALLNANIIAADDRHFAAAANP